MIVQTFFAAVLISVLLAFSSDNHAIEFTYPKNKAAAFVMATNQFNAFKEEWRGEDYYYICENGERGIVCSVLFYKLNKDEQKQMVKPFGGMTSAAIPFIYFSENSNLKMYEKNKVSWGAVTDDFMFRQNDIPEFSGIKISQKHMYAYAMFDKDIFVNIHLSKANCTPEDSTAMRQILDGLRKKK